MRMLEPQMSEMPHWYRDVTITVLLALAVTMVLLTYHILLSQGTIANLDVLGLMAGMITFVGLASKMIGDQRPGQRTQWVAKAALYTTVLITLLGAIMAATSLSIDTDFESRAGIMLLGLSILQYSGFMAIAVIRE